MHWDPGNAILRVTLKNSRVVHLDLKALEYSAASKKRRARVLPSDAYHGIQSHIGLEAVTYRVNGEDYGTPDEAARANIDAKAAKKAADAAQEVADFTLAHPVHLSIEQVRLVLEGVHDPHNMKKHLRYNFMDTYQTGQALADKIVKLLKEKRDEFKRDARTGDHKRMTNFHKAFVVNMNRETARV